MPKLAFKLFLLGLGLGPGFSQNISSLDLDQALTLGLQKNYMLSLSQDQTASAWNRVQSGQGRYLPSASADLSQTGNIDTPKPQTRIGASLNWIVFDGFRTYHAVRQVKSELRSAHLEERAALENLIESIIIGYYDIVQQKQKLAAIRELLAVSEERGKLAKAKLEIGAGSRLEQLQSMADLNQDSSNYLNQEVSLRNAKVKLNQILARDPALNFEVEDSIPLNTSPDLDEWRKILPENNTSIAVARAKRDAAASGIQEARGLWFPNLNTGLTYSAAPKALNSSEVSQGGNLVYSLNMSIPLFDQLATPTGVIRAKLDLRQSETKVKLAESMALAEFEQSRSQYQSGLHLILLEERNRQVARLQAEGAQERFKAGASTALEFRDAQTKLLDAEVRLITARQKAKQAETALQKLSGLLVKQVSVNSEGK